MFNSRIELSTPLVASLPSNDIPKPLPVFPKGRILEFHASQMSRQNELIKRIIEVNNQQVNPISIDQVTEICIIILDLEQKKPLNKRLDIVDLVNLVKTQIQEPYQADRFQNIINRVKQLEEKENLGSLIQIQTNSIYNPRTSIPVAQPYDPIITTEKCEDILQFELTRLINACLPAISSAN